MAEDSVNPHKLDEQSPQVFVGISMVHDGRLRFRYPKSAKQSQLDRVATADEVDA